MIYVRLRGQLGNVLFQYALAKHLAIKNSTNVKFDLIHYLGRKHINARKVLRQLSFFNIEPSVYSLEELNYTDRFKLFFGLYNTASTTQFYHENGWGFDPDVFSLKDGATLFGYFQSEKYFKDIEPVIRREYQFNYETGDKEIIDLRIKIRNTNSVSIHIRRGDYLFAKNLQNLSYTDYFINSLAYISEHLSSPIFFIFSDDIAWCRDNIKVPDCEFVDLKASGENPVIDMHLMSLCKHNIISNSTFSWWAAWLNNNHDKIIVAPKLWFKNDFNALVLKDTIPDEWIKIDSCVPG